MLWQQAKREDSHQLRALMLFTPSSLFVYPSTSVVEVERPIPHPAIANSSVAHKFAYSPPSDINRTKFVDGSGKSFQGLRTILSVISTAISSPLGGILPIKAPFNHSAYVTHFYGPLVQCRRANAYTETLIQELLDSKMAIPIRGARETENAYYAFVPEFSDTGDNSSGGATASVAFQWDESAVDDLQQICDRFQQWRLESSAAFPSLSAL
jgi:hypothetical protein